MVLAGRATRHELRTVYTYPDLVEFNVVLDIEEDMKIEARKANGG